MSPESLNILLVEDDTGERKMLKMLFLESGVPCSIRLMDDGELALNEFNTADASSALAKLHLILLDLNIPKINGLKLLAALKANPALRSIPVIILTTSNSRQDIEESYSSGAAGFIRKPATWEEYQTIIQNVINYWFHTCSL